MDKSKKYTPTLHDNDNLIGALYRIDECENRNMHQIICYLRMHSASNSYHHKKYKFHQIYISKIYVSSIAFHRVILSCGM